MSFSDNKQILHMYMGVISKLVLPTEIMPTTALLKKNSFLFVIQRNPCEYPDQTDVQAGLLKKYKAVVVRARDRTKLRQLITKS